MRAAPGVDAEDDVGVEHLEQRVEVAGPRGGEEGVDDLALAAEVGDRASGAAPRTRRRARLASWRAAAGVRSTIAAISSNGTPNMSCSTKARRSAGDSVSRTTSRASPTESASTACWAGSASSPVLTIGSGSEVPDEVLPPRPARAQHVQAHAGDDRRQPAAQVGDGAPRRSG